MTDIIVQIATMVISNITFVLSMLVVVLIAACFLGRYVVISRKMAIGALGVLFFEAIATAFIMLNEASFIEYFGSFFATAAPDEDFMEIAKLFVTGVESIIINFIAFVYAFVFYMFSYREKRFLRSVGSCIGLYAYYAYMQTTIMGAMVYAAGGQQENVNAITWSDGGSPWPSIIFQCVCLLITAAVVLILYFAYYRKKIFYVLSIKTRLFFLLWLVVFSTFPSLPLVVEESVDERYRILSLIMGILVPVVGTLAPVLVIMNVSDKSLKERFQYQENYLNAELEHIEQYKNRQTETRAFRHDIINNLSLMDMLLKDGKEEEAKAHLEQLLENVSALSPEYVTGDEMLDCIVAMKAGKMKEEGIAFNLDGVVDGGLSMKPMDICRIFANSLDNAIEAVEGLKDGTPKSISMQIKRTERFFVVRISNSTDGKVDVEKLVGASGYSSKKDKEHHGFGIMNIRKAVEEYNGMTKFESTDGEFAISVMIPRQEIRAAE